MSTSEPSDELTAAERRLGQHLELLRETPAPPASLAAHVLRSARWQRAIRAPLLSVAHIAAATIEAVRLLLGGGNRP